MKTVYIRSQDESVQLICERDPMMKKLITVVGDIEIPLRTDYLASIVRSIVGQQISVSAARAIYGRLEELLDGKITAEGLRAKTKEELRLVGLTQRKADYVKDLAEKVASKELDLNNITQYTDEAIIEQLVNVKGIGNWTAEMFLILSLGREDVLAVDDVGIQRAAKWLYEVDKTERRKILIEKSPIWKPYRSIVTYYLWEAIHLGLVTDYESIDEALLKKKIPFE
ncbi:DNA-3-methyladenine glycosylase family protein [Sporosarcina aquimarina]|uniref:DNA-3-methyladenine glycosylase II n=1 Tax=Sporosarcina aquimarina TaxID=114975 RepID=A0ABU4FY91_9BACL|nr:DNA-3-methyladenine glycosylase 2 family protein [Sporosarcina aquimarina]MDW0109683.1 DNA-3-methyladenine glycosylase 2 family protein [Sporosarcina aquimarina]